MTTLEVKPKHLLTLLLVLALAALTFVNFNKNTDEPLTIEGSIMGTTYKVITYGNNDSISKEEIHNIFAEVNEQMSTYSKDSLISQLNNNSLFEWLEVSEGFIEVLNYALSLCIATDGAYDVSIGKLVNLNGFGPTIKDNSYKLNEREVLDQVGCDSTEIDGLYVRRLKDVYLDFSSIAKGYAIDLVHEALVSNNDIKSHYIELGGEIRTSYMKLQNSPWKVGIENPENPNKPFITLDSNIVNNFSLATSGDYRNFKIDNGKVITHTLITKTGKPKEFSKTSVTVLSETAMKSDALATALNAMELQKAILYSNKNSINAIFFSQENGKTKVIFSKSMEELVK